MQVTLIKQKNGVPTVIEVEGRRYVLDLQNKKSGGKKNGSKTVLQDAGKTRQRDFVKA